MDLFWSAAPAFVAFYSLCSVIYCSVSHKLRTLTSFAGHCCFNIIRSLFSQTNDHPQKLQVGPCLRPGVLGGRWLGLFKVLICLLWQADLQAWNPGTWAGCGWWLETLTARHSCALDFRQLSNHSDHRVRFLSPRHQRSDVCPADWPPPPPPPLPLSWSRSAGRIQISLYLQYLLLSQNNSHFMWLYKDADSLLDVHLSL